MSDRPPIYTYPDEVAIEWKAERDALAAKLAECEAKLIAAGEENEELMRVDYWSDRYKIVDKENLELRSKLSEIEKNIDDWQRLCEIFNRPTRATVTKERDQLKAKAQKLVEAARLIDEWWDTSDFTSVVPTKKPNELSRNDSMAAMAIVRVKNALKGWEE